LFQTHVVKIWFMEAVKNGAKSTVDAPEALAKNLAWLLSQASYAIATELTAALEDLNVTPRAHCVLSTAMTGEFTQTELAQAVGLDKTTMVVTIDELEKAGLAERRPSKTDRRARVIAVTKAGARRVAQGAEVVDRVQADVLATLPARERKAFLDALGGLVCRRLATPAECQHSPRRRAARA
jgi:MarR family transcriptional regulator, transcriptional regulator for hemolysin